MTDLSYLITIISLFVFTDVVLYCILYSLLDALSLRKKPSGTKFAINRSLSAEVFSWSHREHKMRIPTSAITSKYSLTHPGVKTRAPHLSSISQGYGILP